MPFFAPVEQVVSPATDTTQIPYPCSSLNNNCEGLLFLAGKIDGAKLEHNRVVQLPAKSYTLSQIWEATQVCFFASSVLSATLFVGHALHSISTGSWLFLHHGLSGARRHRKRGLALLYGQTTAGSDLI